MKRSERRLQPCINQIGRGNGNEDPVFELVRPPQDNYFQLEVIQSKSFRQSHVRGSFLVYRYRSRWVLRPLNDNVTRSLQLM